MVTDPLQEVPIENTYITIDTSFNHRNVYIQNKRSLGRIQYKDGRITCTASGFNRKQVWKLSRVPSAAVEPGEFEFEIEIDSGLVLTTGDNRSLQCKENGTDNLNWKFREVECGKYKMEVGDRVLCVGENGDMKLKRGDARSTDIGQLWTFVPANDCPFVRIKSFQTGGLLTMEDHGDVHAASFKFTDNQTWLLIPTYYGSASENQAFFMQNYRNGSKLAAVEDVRVTQCHRIAGVHGNVEENQLWTMKQTNGYMQFVNCRTRSELKMRSHLKSGPDYIYVCTWVLMPHKLISCFVKFMKGGTTASNDSFLRCEGIDVWSIVGNDKYGYILREPRNTFMLAYNGRDLFLSQESIRETIWYFKEISHTGLNTHLLRMMNLVHGVYQVHGELCYFQRAPFGLEDLHIRFVYRVCGPNENITESISPMAPWSKRTLEQHIGSGSKYKSRFISTTADESYHRDRVFYEVDTYAKRPRLEPRRSVEIDLDLVRRDENLARWCINLSNRRVCEKFLLGSTHRNWATSAKEVIFMDPIPRAMYKIIEPNDLVKPPPPKELAEGMEKLSLVSSRFPI